MKTILNASLAFILAVPVFGAPNDKDIVTVNGVPIRQSEVLERLWGLYGMPTLNQMVDELLLRQEAKTQKVKAQVKDIDSRIAEFRSQFEDNEKFQAHLKSLGTTLDVVKIEMEDQLLRENLIIKEHDLSVDKKELKEAFEKFKPRLGTPPAVHLRHILVQTGEQAKSIVGRIKAGADFKQLAQEHSIAQSGKLAGGDYGFVRRGLLPKDIEEAAFSMDVKELKVVASQRGHHILQVLGKRAAEPAEFKKVKGDLERLLMTEKINSVLPDYLRKLRAKAEIQPKGTP